MQIRRQMILSTVAVVLAGGTSLTAQVTTGALNGKLSDSNGKPVVGARVTLESSALFNPRVVTTDARGEYRALLLPVGDYTLKVSAQGYLAKTATNVRVGVGSNLTMSFVLNAMTTATQTVEVVSDLAAAAKTDDKISTNFSAEKLMQLPTGQGGPSFAGALGATPGVAGAYAASATKVRGGETNQVMYRINGINVKDDTGVGALYEPLPDAIEDVQVVLTALNARFGSVSGGQVNVVTKSGSNEFEGTIRNEFSRSSWTADQRYNTSNLAANRSEKFQQHTDVVVSGPIIKDRLWFYLGTRFQPSKSMTATLGEQVTGVGVDASGTANGTTYTWDYVRQHLTACNTLGAFPELDKLLLQGPNGYSGTSWMSNAGDTVYGNVDYKKYDAKLTGAITDAHLLSATYLYEKTTQGPMSGERHGSPLQVFNPAQAGTTTTESKGWTLNWNGTLASNWTVEARISSMKREQSDVQRNPGSYTGPSIWVFLQSDNAGMKLLAPSTSWQNKYWYFNMASPRAMSSYNTPERRGNETYSVNITTFQELAGQHQIDFGFQRENSLWNFGRARAGSAAVYSDGCYVNSAGEELYPVFFRTPLNNGTVPFGRNAQISGGIVQHNGVASPSKSKLTDPVEPTIDDPGLFSNGGKGSIWGMADVNNPNFGASKLTGDPYTQWGSQTSVGTHFERNWIRSQDEKNHTDALYVNDSWTINSQWNVMVGARYNKMSLQMYGKDAQDMNVFEPRAMVKYNPDGNNKNIYSISYAKLSQVYSDKIANYFRGNEWTMQSMQHWTGGALDAAIQQHGFDSVASQNDYITDGQPHNGYTYDSTVNMRGLRFVDYKTLTNQANYSTSASYSNKPATCDISDLRVPYALELNLGFQHNFSQGWFKLNAVQRKYNDRILGYNWAAVSNFGRDNWKIISSPVTGSTQQSLAWKDMYRSSTHGQTYRSLEFSFDRQLTSRWDLTGSFTVAQATGPNEEEYYKHISLREGMLTPEELSHVAPDTVLANDKYGYLAVTYVQPVGKGNISLSARLNYNNNGGYGSLTYTKNYMNDSRFSSYVAGFVPKDAGDSTRNPDGLGWSNGNAYGTASGDMDYSVYYGSAGQYRTNFDTYTADLKLNADLPIYKKLHFIGYVTMSNIFNAYQLTNMHTAMSNMSGTVGGNSYAAVAGRGYQSFTGNYEFGKGQNALNPDQRYSDYNWGNPGRQITNVSIGLKF